MVRAARWLMHSWQRYHAGTIDRDELQAELAGMESSGEVAAADLPPAPPDA